MIFAFAIFIRAANIMRDSAYHSICISRLWRGYKLYIIRRQANIIAAHCAAQAYPTHTANSITATATTASPTNSFHEKRSHLP